MRYVVGIDLGSTTTKAVVLQAAGGPDSGEGRVLGRGITNSRSNYDVACSVALADAMVDARLAMVNHALEGSGVGAGRRKDVVADLTLRFRELEYRRQLGELSKQVRALSGAADSSGGELERRAVDTVLSSLEDGAGELFTRDAQRKSDFFRDLAGSQYMHDVEELTRPRGCAGGTALPSFDYLVGLYDKAILKVENLETSAAEFEDCIGSAAVSLLGAYPELGSAVEEALSTPLEKMASVGTGYGRSRLPFEEAQIRSEILCHGLGASTMFPGTRTVLDIGGQDTKAIQVDERGIVTSFQMNDRCAAGCGRYLGYIADEMNLGLHELGPLANKGKRPVRINSTCTVFAGAELRERLSLGERREDVLAGLHRAIILRAMSLLARSGGVRDEFTFTGGVANNSAAVRALRGLVSENYGEVTMNISPASIYTGALGAAMFAARSLTAEAPAA